MRKYFYQAAYDQDEWVQRASGECYGEDGKDAIQNALAMVGRDVRRDLIQITVTPMERLNAAR